MNETYKIKTALLHYLRYTRQCFVATEVSYLYGIADVVYIPKKKEDVNEIEIKVSKTDFLKDFIKKEHKHECLQSNNRIINYFYFCVPITLKEFALEQLKDLPYGLYVFEEKWKHKNKLQEQLELQECITLVKKATVLCKEKSIKFNELKDNIALRAMSELATLYKLQYYNGTKSNRVLIRDKVDNKK